MITQQELKELLSYDPVTGIFVWLVDIGNVRAGTIAGSIRKTRTPSYVRITINKKSYLAHNLAWLYIYGYVPYRIDHKDCNDLNNSIDNLRPCSQAQNRANSRKKNSRSGFKGVAKNGSGWMAYIGVSGKRICLGTFSDPEVAHREYVKKAIEIYGEFARAG